MAARTPALLSTLVVLIPVSCALVRPEPPPDPAELALDRVRRDHEWRTARRAELDSLFTRVVGAPVSNDALSWLRVYLLAQVADDHDRAQHEALERELDERLAALEAGPARAAADLAADVTAWRAEIDALRGALSVDER
jgi:hypothetical protein